MRRLRRLEGMHPIRMRAALLLLSFAACSDPEYAASTEASAAALGTLVVPTGATGFKYRDTGARPPAGELVISYAISDRIRGVPRLCYRFILDTTRPLNRYIVDIDASTLALVRISSVEATGLALSLGLSQA